MKVNVLKKVVVTSITYGFNYNTDVIKHNDVLSIAEVIVNTVPTYRLTLANNGTAITVDYSQKDYLINILP